MCSSAEEIAKLKLIIEEKDHDLICSAQHGKSLLETNAHLEEVIDKLHGDYEKLTEEYEQYKHSTGLKLELLEKSEQRNESHLAEVKEFLHCQHAKETEANSKKHEIETNDLKRKISEMRDEVDERNLSIQQLSNKVEFLQARISELECKAIYSAPMTPTKPHDEILELMAKNEKLNHHLKSVTQEFVNYKESSEMQNNLLHKTVETLKQEKQSFEQENVQSLEALRDCQEQLKDLKDELELVRLETQNPNSKGNSLFGEVEDRRVQAEKKYLSAKVRLQGMERKYKNQVNYSIQLKTQLIHSQHGRSETDKQQISKLRSALGESRSDVKHLVDKVDYLEGKLSQKGSSDVMQVVKTAQHDNHVIELLKNVIQEKELQVSKYEKECRQSRLDLIMETRRGDSAESGVFESKRLNEQLRGTIAKLQLDNTRLRLKCGEEVEGKSGVKFVRTETLKPNENVETAPSTEQKDQENLPPEGVKERVLAESQPSGTGGDDVSPKKRQKISDAACLDQDCPEACKQQ